MDDDEDLGSVNAYVLMDSLKSFGLKSLWKDDNEEEFVKIFVLVTFVPDLETQGFLSAVEVEDYLSDVTFENLNDDAEDFLN